MNLEQALSDKRDEQGRFAAHFAGAALFGFVLRIGRLPGASLDWGDLMALNAIERRMLMLAREKLLKCEATRICYALTYASDDMKIGPATYCEQVLAARVRLQEFIQTEIQAFGLEDWVRTHGGKHRRKWFSVEFMRRARIQWIDWLLDEPWTDHAGGRCPLWPTERAHVRLRNGSVYGPRLDGTIRTADTYRWEHWEHVKNTTWNGGPFDIVAYKVIYEAPHAD